MHPPSTVFDIATMTVAEFKAFKRALRILQVAGLDFHVAVEILTTKHADRRAARMRAV